MTKNPFLHDASDFDVLISRVQRDYKNVIGQLIEKDYWIMHCLWGLKKQGFKFELKGGTSLSKGFGIINRFSEDIDIKIEPPATITVRAGKNDDKQKHIDSRILFFDWLAKTISIPGVEVERDSTFDGAKFRNAGIRLNYKSTFPQIDGVKPYILLEVGFDVTTPNRTVDISSWAYDFATKFNLAIEDNRARAIPCYLPGYTLVEKLSAISRKYRQEQEGRALPINFIRHYYDVYQLLDDDTVLTFIGTEAYRKHKEIRFQSTDELDLTKNQAFALDNLSTRKKYKEEYQRTRALYFDEAPNFEQILDRIYLFLPRL